MDIIELTRQLGAAIQQDERYQKFMQIKEQNDADEELQKQIGEFNLLKMQLDTEFAKEDNDAEKVRELNERVLELYNEIMSGDAMKAYNEAYAAYQTLVKRINGILQMSQNGEDPATCEPSSCSGSCSTCGGCH